ncbi:hypothetical protein PILCRDRAFT_715327 [Piloderma croceum F 1598]|uniref:Uncharacterized protein n=1 Tax=Piloderma croceum (strain F 1598) TaxID=765440 RepID=A0A0C3F1C6_PILCF|nr:hypothetical protein PILCRDRAFT_715327 [Piloderma croceum F 1598]
MCEEEPIGRLFGHRRYIPHLKGHPVIRWRMNTVFGLSISYLSPWLHTILEKLRK